MAEGNRTGSSKETLRSQRTSAPLRGICNTECYRDDRTFSAKNRSTVAVSSTESLEIKSRENLSRNYQSLRGPPGHDQPLRAFAGSGRHLVTSRRLELPSTSYPVSDGPGSFNATLTAVSYFAGAFLGLQRVLFRARRCNRRSLLRPRRSTSKFWKR